jgi:hypothetical protein
MSKPPPLPRKHSRWASAVQVALGICAALLAVAVAWYAFGRIKESRYVKRLEAQIRQKGEPLTLADLAAKYPTIPDDQNAAIPLLKVWEQDDPNLWQAFRRKERPLPHRLLRSFDPDLPFLGQHKFEVGQALTPASRQAAKEFLSARAAHLDAIRVALARPKCRFPVDVEEGFDALLPHLAEIKEEAQTLRIEALIAADSGNCEEAVAVIQQIFEMSRLLESEPFSISRLIEAAGLQIGISSGEDMLSRGRLSDAQLGRLKTILNGIDARAMLQETLKRERAHTMSMLNSSALKPSTTNSTMEAAQDRVNYRRSLRMMSALGLVAKDRRLVLEHMGETIENSGREFPEMFAHQQRLETELEQKMRGFPPAIFAAIIFPATKSVVSRFIALEARKRSALVALEVERYRSGHNGELPKTLDSLEPALSPQFLEDPFDGKPLRFRATENGYVVYSVGANLTDDGGTPVGTRKAKGFDETFRLNFRGVSTNSAISRP